MRDAVHDGCSIRFGIGIGIGTGNIAGNGYCCNGITEEYIHGTYVHHGGFA
jgi:hypothetical protein